MKPSEVEDSKKAGPTYRRYIYDDGKLSGTTFTTIERSIRKTRIPMTYSPKTFWHPLNPKSKYFNVVKILRPKPYTALVDIRKRGIVVQTQRAHKKAYTEITGVWNYDFNPSLPDWVKVLIENERVQANVDFINKVHERKFTLLEEIRNRQETGGSLWKTAEKLVRTFLRFSRNPIKALKKVPKEFRSARKLDTLGDAWMEYRYFWMPIYLSMQAGFDELLPEMEFTGVFKKSEWSSHEWEDTLGHPNGATAFVRPPKVKYMVKTQFKRGCFIKAEDEPGIQRKLGINSLPELTATAWELIPFSFVVDWVFPLSDLLLALGAKANLVTHNDYQVQKQLITAEVVDWELKKPYSNATMSYDYYHIQTPEMEEYEAYFRTTNKTADLTIRPFIAREPLNWRRKLDLLAIFGTGKQPLAKKLAKRELEALKRLVPKNPSYTE